MAINIIDGPLRVRGRVTPEFLDVPAETITNQAVSSSAAIAATKLQHEHHRTYAQESGTAAADETRVVHVVRGATATLVGVAAGAVGPAIGDATVSVDLKKNGVSMLTAPIELSSSQSAYELVAGAFASGALVQGDVLEVEITGTAGTGTLPDGVFCCLVVREAPA